MVGSLASVGLAGPAMAQSASDVDCGKCVDTSDIARQAVSNARIKKNTIKFNRLNRALQQRIQDLEQQVATLQALVLGNAALDLGAFVSVVNVTQDVNGVPTDLPTIRLEGVNLQIVNGTGQTIPVDTLGPDGPNGLGNLIIGYDEAGTGGQTCSDGRFTSIFACETAGAVAAVSHKSGTHNLVVGAEHNYSQAAGAVLGFANQINGTAATVTGGLGNVASGIRASVSGGSANVASGEESSVSGGDSNEARNGSASVSGGVDNTASGLEASVSGGADNRATGTGASVSGGRDNTASGNFSSVLGGTDNDATMENQAIPPIPGAPPI